MVDPGGAGPEVVPPDQPGPPTPSEGTTDGPTVPSETASDTGSTGSTGTATEGGFCEARRVFDRNCVQCHGSVEPQGGLDLRTDPWAATVGLTSATYGVALVSPGDPEGSLLWTKMAGTQLPSQGGLMPPTGPLVDATETIRQWILDGAPQACTATDTIEPVAYHPEGWAAPEVHGLATKLQTESDCRTCHGSDLSGGSSTVSCTSCHGAGWETTCTYCHGGVESATGAPPEDIDDNADPATISFVPHTVHGAGRISAAFDCVVCHAKPTNALTPGHLFDDATPGAAEVVFAAGLYDAATGTCSDLDCHGNGLGANGRVSAADGPRTCGSCHPDATDDTRWTDMSGRHRKHLSEGFACADCHPDALNSDAIDLPALHVNGGPDVELPVGMAFDAANGTCEGTCHDERHRGRVW